MGAILFRKTVPCRHHGGFGAVICVQLAQNIADVVLHRLLADEERLGDFPIALAGRHLHGPELPAGRRRPLALEHKVSFVPLQRGAFDIFTHHPHVPPGDVALDEQPPSFGA